MGTTRDPGVEVDSRIEGVGLVCRILCSILCHPQIERWPRLACTHCPCGRVAIADERWHATFRQ